MEPRRSARVAALAATAPSAKRTKSSDDASSDEAKIKKTKSKIPAAAAGGDIAKLCCLKSCSKPLAIADRIVEVRSGEKPAAADSKAQWGAGGRAHFHGDCWQTLMLLQASRKADEKLSAEERRCVKEAAARAEYYDPPQIMREKAHAFVELLRKSKHVVVFTGAGVSTAAGIGDYRGLTGAWTLQELAPKEDEVIDEGVPYETLRPTYTHEAISKLVEMGIVKYLISQNCDGLHLLSGVPEDNISELHGNVFLEFCVKCRKTYVRDYYVMDDSDESDNCPRCHFNHLTGRKCDVVECKGDLSDTIINFGDLLDERTLKRAEQHASASDLFISLGSTMLVTPAANLIQRAAASVICNRQKTGKDYDEKAKVRAWGDCDKFFKLTMMGLLGEEEERKWSASLERRQKQYDKQRKN